MELIMINKTARLCMTVLLLGASTPLWAEEAKPDDHVSFNLMAESWVTTTTARVVVTVDAAVAGSAAGGMRAEMQKAVSAVAKADWRLTSFTRNQDATGLERWNASYEARLPENDLAGLHDSAKKASKAGLQLTVNAIAFDPTLAEIEATKAKLRTDLYKQANDQLATLNSAIPTRQYRISALDFAENGMPVMPPRPMMMAKTVTMNSMASPGAADSEDSMEHAEKIVQQVQVTFAALPPIAGK